MSLLFLTDFYPPGYRSGGPARSCYNLSIGLGNTVPVQVLTRDRDLNSPLPYPDIALNTWQPFAPGVQVNYSSPSRQGLTSIIRSIRQVAATTLYLNSMFSVPFTIYPLLAHWLGLIKGRVVLAPRGMLKASALQFKPFKKKLFLGLIRALGWHRFIVFQATSPEEARDVHTAFGPTARVVTCPPVPELGLLRQRVRQTKSIGMVRFCLVGRVHPIKNIHRALELLAGVAESPVYLEVIGPLEDAAYYAHCQSIAAGLPATVQVRFLGALPTEEVQARLQQADFFYLLTQGENFGHAIFEALALGKPVIISDQTPWRDLCVQQAGWDLALSEPEQIRKALQQAMAMPDAEYQQWSDGAYARAEQFVEASDWKRAYLELFELVT